MPKKAKRQHTGSGNRKAKLTEKMIQMQWKPGQSGNPKGRMPGSRTWKTIVKELCDLEYTTPEKIKKFFPNDTYSIQEITVMAQTIKAMQGGLHAAEFLRDTAGEKPSIIPEGFGSLAPVTKIIFEGVAAEQEIEKPKEND